MKTEIFKQESNSGYGKLDGEAVSPEDYIKLLESYPEEIIESRIIPPKLGGIGFGRIYINHNFPKYILKIIQSKKL